MAGDTNSVLVQLFFGTNQNNEVFVRRADEDFVYAVTAEDFNRLPEAAWEFRDRRIWNFNESRRGANHNPSERKDAANGPQRAEQVVARPRFAGHHQSAGHRGNGPPAGGIDRRRLGGAQRDRAGKIRSQTGKSFPHH